MDIIFRLGNTYSGRGRRSKSSGWTYPYDWKSGSQLSSRTWQCTNEQRLEEILRHTNEGVGPHTQTTVHYLQELNRKHGI